MVTRRMKFKLDDYRLPAEFWQHVKPDAVTGCWYWEGPINSGGYGQFYWKGRTWLAHRLSFSRLVTPADDGYVIDHVCRERNCVFPGHLDLVTHKVNVQRGDARHLNGAYDRRLAQQGLKRPPRKKPKPRVPDRNYVSMEKWRKARSEVARNPTPMPPPPAMTALQELTALLAKKR